MADEAFALSPISARAALPSEEDYDAISQAFMETSRGRWFLGEYAKRNRNADTRMVLDAVARIEQTIAAQQQPPPNSELADALTAVSHTLDEAEAAATAALDGLALEENLAPVRKGARIIKEISWRWREIGADARICDLLDSQVVAIEGACGQISSAGAASALSAAFDLIRQRIAGFDDDSDGPAPQAVEDAVPPPSPAGETPVAAVETVQETAPTSDPETSISPAMSAETMVAMPEAAEVTTEVDDVPPEAVDVVVEAAAMTSETAAESPEATDAYDEALLDMVALEMAAPDPSDIDDLIDIDTSEIHVADQSADPIIS